MRVLFFISLFFTTPVFATEFTPTDVPFIKKMFNSIQALSFKNDREYCGYIYITAADVLGATKAVKGDEGSCLAPEPAPSLNLIASYHTHGAFSIDADSELPSNTDMLADISENIDGFIATPGGRIWYIDSEAKTAKMICGEKCILADPNFKGHLLDPVKNFYTIDALKAHGDDG